MKVYCILSDERAFRLKSPSMFSTIMQRHGIKATYVPFMVKPEDIGQAMQSLRILNIAGANVTVPYKEAVIPYLDILSEGANIIGAINTIVIKEDQLKGYNTNAIGIMDAMGQAEFEIEGKSALVFGSGGAAKAVVFVLNWLRAAQVYVCGRSAEKAQSLVKRFGGETIAPGSLCENQLPVHIIINATSVSSDSEAPEFPPLIHNLDIPDCELVFDLNYGRQQNFWQDLAAKRDIPFMDGLPPLAYQAQRTFALWTGMQVPPDDFIQAINNGM